MAKLSSREKKAQKLGGTLNYKSGKISTPKKSSSSSSSSSYKKSSYGTDPSLESEMGYIASPQYQQSLDSGYKMSDAEFSSKNKEHNDKKSKSSSKTPTRTTAAPAYNGFGSSAVNTVKNFVNTAPQRIGNGGLAGLLNKGVAEAGGLWDTLRGEGIGGAVNQLGEDIMLGMRNAGGIFGEKAQAMEFPLAPGISINDRGIIQSDPTYPDNPNATPSEIINQGRGPINVPGVTDTGINTNNRTPKPTTNQPTNTGISNPFNISSPFIPESSGISSAYQPDFSSGVDNGTVRRPIGMGQFSSGQHANGAGNYGLIGSGGSVGNPWNLQDAFNYGLGIPTAKAGTPADEAGLTPGSPEYTKYNDLQSQYDNYQNQINTLEGYVNGTGGDAGNLMNAYDQQTQNEMGGLLAMQPSAPQSQPSSGMYAYNQPDLVPQQDNVLTQLMSMAGLGNTAQASGLGMPGITGSGEGKSSSAYDDSTYKKQQKNAEKANKEYLKSIDRQYSEAQTTGTQDLEKAKQQDLLKLSGLFNFANQDPDSGQRIQYEQRANQDYAGQLTALIAKLASAKATDRSTAQQSLQKVLSEIQSAKQAAQQRTADLQRQQQQQQFSRLAQVYGLIQGQGQNYGNSGEVDIFGNPV